MSTCPTPAPEGREFVSDSNSSLAPSAGWYTDPEYAGQLRYWDGSAWTEHRTPDTGTVSQPQGTPDMTYAWTLAFTPVIWLLLDVLLLQVAGSDHLMVSNAAAIGVTVALAILDSKALAKSGVRLSAWWGALLLPVYLILRTKRAGSTAAIPIVWFVLAVGYAAASTPVMYALEDAGYSASPSSSAEGIFDDTWSDSLESYTCDELADEAVAVSEKEGGGVSLLKVRGLRTIEDNTSTYSLPSGSGESLVLACRGTGVWSDGDTSTEVRLELTVDADGDSWISYNAVW